VTIPAAAFRVDLIVSPDEVDMQGHVSNVTIVKWFSRAAWNHSVALGYALDTYQRLGAWFVVRRHEIDYHAPARQGDALALYTWPCARGKVTAQRRHQLIRAEDNQLIAAGLNTWAYVDIQTGRPRRIPREIAEAFDPARFR